MSMTANIEIGSHPIDLLTFLRECQTSSKRCALVTIVNFVGSSSRQLGSNMAVCEDGRYAGSVSSGCFDANVVAFAIRSIQENRQKRIKLGEGSPFVDVKLPCGGGVELLIIPEPDKSSVSHSVDALMQRTRSGARINDSGFHFDDTIENTGWCGEEFHIRYQPKIKIFAAGRGEELASIAKIASVTGFEVVAASPDKTDLAVCEKYGATAFHLNTIDSVLDLDADAWTAIVLLFHDHEWEPPILEAGLRTNAFYLGALGSRQTHAARLEGLRAMDIPEEQLSRIHGPIGLVPSMRNTAMLAISTLAEIIDIFNSRERNNEPC